MTVGELLEVLQYEDLDAEVRLAHQPRWAFEYSIAGVASARVDGRPVVYLAEGDQLGYLPKVAAIAVGWENPDDDLEDEQAQEDEQ